MNHAMQFSLMNSLRTGHMMIDMIICILIPFILNAAFHRMSSVGMKFLQLQETWAQRGNVMIRHIEYIKRINTWGAVKDTEQKNHVLQKAIALYIGRKVLVWKSARVELVDAQSIDGVVTKVSGDSVQSSAVEQMSHLKINTLPPLDQWVEIESNLWFRHSSTGGNETKGGDEKASANGIKESVVVFSIKATNIKMTSQQQQEEIDLFLQKAYRYYLDKIQEYYDSDTSRYMYILWRSNMDHIDEGNSVNDMKLYKRYRLGEHKTFSSLFFEQKQPLRELLDKFLRKEGKFAVQGFPHKLGLLLHGPPGTGKTSLIKAIAQYTKRHVVCISLAKIRTNQELMDSMFDKVFRVQSEDVPTKLNFDQIVFVMEDVDAATSVVHAREDEEGPIRQSETEPIELQNEMMNVSFQYRRSEQDKLNLAGLLNVLDGVVDSPNRVVIMTSNYPEKLDPALIRPGRINKQIMLGYMKMPEMKQMLEHYFETTISDVETQRLETQLLHKEYTPAAIEQFCAEHDTITQLLDALSI